MAHLAKKKKETNSRWTAYKTVRLGQKIPKTDMAARDPT
jgi:hypothetical protein